MLAYNTTVYTATNFAPAYLLRGYMPITRSTVIHKGPSIDRSQSLVEKSQSHVENSQSHLEDSPSTTEQRAADIAEEFEYTRTRAKEALYLSQAHQQRAYNKGRLTTEFEEGDWVVLNPHSLELLRSEKGRGRKLLMKYDGPFEIIRKLSPVTYQIRLPASYGMHPILNIAHLEKYVKSPDALGDRPTHRLGREDFDIHEEWEVECIVNERLRKTGKGRKVREFKTRFKGFGPNYDKWLTKAMLRNAPEVLLQWE